ncbi:MAG: metalloregulator ArsR/SmtB family transcription factor [Steroidobacteraceae bacterium]
MSTGTRTKPSRTSEKARVVRKPALAPGEILAHAAEASAFLKALANEQRLCILCTLLEKPLSVSELNEEVDLSQSALSQHLAVLREGGLVAAERQAQTITYSVPEGDVRRVLGVLQDIFCGK